MVENIQNSFEGYTGLFTFYIFPINYAIFMGQILIFGLNWAQNTILSTFNLGPGAFNIRGQRFALIK